MMFHVEKEFKGHGAGFLLRRAVSGEKNVKRGIQRRVVSKRNPQHRDVAFSSTCRRRSLQKGFLSMGKL